MQKWYCFLLLYFFSSSAYSDEAIPSKKKVLICGVCKNIESSASNAMRNIEALGKKFKDYVAIIYENNSTDNTAKILAKWAKSNRHVVFISETLTNAELSAACRAFTWDKKPSRMEVIARARNIVLSIARSVEYDDFEYIIMVDLDFQKPWPMQEILNSMSTKGDWDCISANGVLSTGIYYDRYALRSELYPFGPEILGQHWWTEVQLKSLTFENANKLIPVYSAFGGLAIYKRASIIPFFYSGYVTEDLRKDTSRILCSLPKSNFFVQMYLKMHGKEHYFDHDRIPIIFSDNSGYDFPVCCEHVTLHASMRLHGHGKIYINPKMIMQSEQ